MIEHCSVCNSKIRTVYSQKNEDILGMAHDYTQHIGICEKCGFIFTQNPFDDEKLAKRYKNESKFEYDSSKYILDERSEYARRCIVQKEFIDRSIEGKYESVVEVGAASGYNLSLYKGKKLLGIEPSTINCKLAKVTYGLDMFNGTYQEYFDKAVTEKYDLVFLSMTLEHIVDPYNFLLKLKRINSKYVFIEVPTLDIKYINEPFGLFCEEHVNYFTLEGLNSIMTAVGYGLVDAQLQYGFEKRLPAGWPAIDTVWELGRKSLNMKPIFSSVELLDKYIQINQEELENISRKIDAIPDNEKLAIWGTGHHVSMLLANTSLSKKNIIKFYDSDVRKHKYTMHGKTISAFDTGDIHEGVVEGILLGTYVFQNQLEKIVRPYSEQCNIYKLY